MPDRWEQAHVEPALGDQDLRGLGLDARDRAQQLNDLGVRGEHKLDRADPAGAIRTSSSRPSGSSHVTPSTPGAARCASTTS